MTCSVNYCSAPVKADRLCHLHWAVEQHIETANSSDAQLLLARLAYPGPDGDVDIEFDPTDPFA